MLPTLDELKTIIVKAAETELLPAFAKTKRTQKSDGSIVTTADIAMQKHVTEQLRRRWPEYAVLGEELSDTAQRRLLDAAAAGLWCLDPLDGTSNFAYGIPFFAASLALLRDGNVQLGLVYDPIREECYTAEKGKGAWLNGTPLVKADCGLHLHQAIGLVDFKRLPAALATRLVGERPYGSQRSFGAVALDWCWLAAGRCHVYLHGRQKLWDYAAGNLVFEQVGGHAVTLQGEPVFRHDLIPRSAIAALDDTLFQEWAEFLGVTILRQ